MLGVISLKEKQKSEYHEAGSPADDQRNSTTETGSAANHADILDGLRALRPSVLKMFARIERITQKVDEAFAGQPFWPNLPPDAPANRRRFKAYIGLHEEAVKLFLRTQELWMLAHGIQIVRRQHPRRGAGRRAKGVTTAPSIKSRAAERQA